LNLQYDESRVDSCYQECLNDARSALQKLKVARDSDPSFAGLNGWVFEQTIKYCLTQELLNQGVKPIITDQPRIQGKKRCDLAIGLIRLEIKVSGLYNTPDKNGEKLAEYRRICEEKGWIYMLFSCRETYEKNRKKYTEVLGEENVFILSCKLGSYSKGEWSRFIERTRALLDSGQNSSAR